jgi:hypothetical protein
VAEVSARAHVFRPTIDAPLEAFDSMFEVTFWHGGQGRAIV